jgi:hypothetical protein
VYTNPCGGLGFVSSMWKVKDGDAGVSVVLGLMVVYGVW